MHRTTKGTVSGLALHVLGRTTLCALLGVWVLGALALSTARAADAPDMSKPVQVYILLGQSNMVGAGHIGGDKPGTLEHAVKAEKKYPYLVDADGNWAVMKGVRYVFTMGTGGNLGKVLVNQEMSIQGNKRIGPEFGIAHELRQATDAPILILKSCIGNRCLAYDLLPPGSKPIEYQKGGKTIVQAGYGGYGEWEKGTTPPTKGWRAGCQYDSDVGSAKKILSALDKYYPGAKGYEIAGFFWWQGDKDRYRPWWAAHYEENLVNLIKALRKDFNAPNAKFVCATLGQTKKGAEGSEGLILDAQLAVDGDSGKHPEFKGNVATVYSNPLSLGGASNGHYSGNAETYMNIGQAMGKAMAGLIPSK